MRFLILLAGCLPVTQQFQPPTHFPSEGPPESMEAGDINGDGKLDLVVARGHEQSMKSGAPGENASSYRSRPNAGALSILLGNGDGTFRNVNNIPGWWAPDHPCITDFNHDGKPDLAVLGLMGYGITSVLLGKGDGTFLQPNNVVVGYAGSSPKAGDLNGDGNMDLLITDVLKNSGGSDVAVSVEGSKLAVLLGRGDGTFEAPRILSLGRELRSVSVGDWNGDGKLDVVLADWLDLCIYFLAGAGDGSFREPMRLTTPFKPFEMRGVDLNNDGKLDLVAGADRGVMVFLGRGDGSFDSAGDYYTDVGHYLAVADFNHDGKPDIARGRRILIGDGRGSFTVYNLPELSHYDDSWLVGADFDGDGWPDLVAGDASHDVIEIYRNHH
jgi:hypothetical protein